VARYYFDIWDGTTLVRDDEGTAFDNPDAAVQAAAGSAAEIGTNRLAKGDFSDVVIEVRDESDHRVGRGIVTSTSFTCLCCLSPECRTVRFQPLAQARFTAEMAFTCLM
jgi:hypothetical protein